MKRANITLNFIILFIFISNIAYAGADKSGVKPSVLSLPSGPGAIEGLGESFEPQLNSGTGSYRVPLAVSPGRNGFAPQLVLAYNSGNSNGAFGLGWKIDFPFIQRQTDKGQPFYTDWTKGDNIDNDKDGETDEADENDTPVYSGGEELVPLSDGSFRCENESEFIKFSWSSNGWTAKQKNGATLKFGVTSQGRIQDDTGRIFQWLLEELSDTNGNTIRLVYEKLDSGLQRYCTRIEYNYSASSNMVIQFEYESRPDIITDCRPRYELKTAYRCKAIRMIEDEKPVRSYLLAYEPTDNFQPLSLLSGITQIGRDAESSLPPAQFTYIRFQGDTAKSVQMLSAPKLSLNDGNIDLIDLNTDGLPDILNTNDKLHDYYLNMGQGEDGKIIWSERKAMTSMPKIIYLMADSTQLADMDGDGSTDMLDLFGTDIQYYRIKKDNSGLKWESAGLINKAGFNFQDPNVRLADLNNDKMTDVMKTASGVSFVWLNLKQGRWSNAFISALPNSQLQFDRSYLRLADMNGDRVQDLVWIQNDMCSYYPGKGFGEFGSGVQMSNSPFGVTDESRLLMADVNGDGMDDTLYVGTGTVKVWINLGLNPSDHTKGRFANSFTVTAPYTDSYTVFRQCDMNGNGSKDILWNTYPTGGNETFVYLDFAPDEQPYQLKTITNGIGRTITISYRSSVKDMTRDRDAETPWIENIPFPVPVVAKVEINDGLNTYSSEFQYHDGYYDGNEKEFRGFAKAEKQEIGDETIPDLIMAYMFDIGVTQESLKGKPLSLKAQTADGEIFYQESYTWTTRKLADGINGDIRSVTFPYQKEKTRNILEKGNGTPVALKWEYVFDDYGNMIQQTEHGRLDAGWDDERITKITYSSAYPSCVSNWMLDKAVESTVTDENGLSVSKKRNYYDGNLILGAVSKGNLTSVEDWVSEEKYIVSARNDYDEYGNIIAIYDPLYGQKPGHYRKLVYDDIFHTFPIEEHIYTGYITLTMTAGYDFGLGVMTSSTDFNGYTTTYNYDTFGRLISITKPPDTEHTVEYDYSLAYDLGNRKLINWVETRQRDGSADEFLYSRTFYDGLGRKIMTRSEGENTGQVVVTDTLQFNARQLPWKKYLPYFENGGLDFTEPTFNTGFTEHFYDAMGREIRVNQPLGSDGIVYSAIAYQPLVRIVKDEEQTKPDSQHYGCGMRYVEDGLQDKDGKGRLREVYEIVRLSDTGNPLTNPAEWKTIYSYDLLDNLTSYVDSQKNQKFIEYDRLGRKTFMNDPDRGYMYYVYDDAGNLIWTKDAKNQVIEYDYDGVNRLTEEYYGEGKTTPDVVYHYDLPSGSVDRGEFWQAVTAKMIADSILDENEYNAGYDLNNDGMLDVADVVSAAQIAMQNNTVLPENTKGFLSWIQDQSGEEHNSYDERGRVNWVVKRINTQNSGLAPTLRNFYTGMAYDSMDRVTNLTYPDNTHVAYTYNSRGLLESVPDVITQYDYNPAGQNSRLSLVCGTVTSYDYDHRLRLKQLKTVRSNDNLAIQDLNYSYDGVSNITQIYDNRNNIALDKIGGELGIGTAEARKFNATQSFVYDSLYRLTQAANASVYGTIKYRYDRIGNMIAKNASLITPDPIMDLGEMTCGGVLGTHNRIGRNPGDAPGPHAITGTEKGEGGGMSFAYDDNGNMISDNGMSMSWDYQDRLVNLKKGTKRADYVYDYTDTRKRKTVADSETGENIEVIYIDKFSEVRDGKLVKYVYAGNSRIARSEATQDSLLNSHFSILNFYLHDHLGSTAYTLTDKAAVAEGLVNYPYGSPRLERRAETAFRSADYKFTGKERDLESGLQYFEARYLTGFTGRFVSVDPLVAKIKTDINIPQILNSYSYANGNPLNYIDPDGNNPIGTIDYGLYLSTKLDNTKQFSKNWWDIINAKMALFSFIYHNIELASTSGGFQKKSKNTSLEGIRPETYQAIVSLRYSYLDEKYKYMGLYGIVISIEAFLNKRPYGIDALIGAFLDGGYRPAYTGKLIVTAGTEPGHDEKIPFPHKDGYKIDLAPTPELNEYITTYGVVTGKRNDGATGYALPGIYGTFFDERHKAEPHWDYSAK